MGDDIACGTREMPDAGQGMYARTYMSYMWGNQLTGIRLQLRGDKIYAGCTDKTLCGNIAFTFRMQSLPQLSYKSGDPSSFLSLCRV